VSTTRDAVSAQQLETTRPPRRRPLDMLLRAQQLPLGCGIVVAVAFISAEACLVNWLQHSGSENSFRALFLLGVLVVSAGWEFRLALATTLASGLVYFLFHVARDGPIVADDFIALLVFFPIALVANVLGWQARVRARESEVRRQEADDAAWLAKSLTRQQAALRRVAAQVARGVTPGAVLPDVVAELSTRLSVDSVTLLRYESDGTAVVVDACDHPGKVMAPNGEFLPLTVPTAERIPSLGLRSTIRAPILVDGRIWGALIVGSAGDEPPPHGVDVQVADFAELISTAITNAETRARNIAAGDQARRRFERDVHDGIQQHVVYLGLRLREVAERVPRELQELQQEISLVIAGLGAVGVELRELSHGMHPPILSRGGLPPAIKALARRSAIAVALDVRVTARMPENVEAAAYYVVAEALTNAIKYSNASEVHVGVDLSYGNLQVTIRDDGIGGAAVGSGSGLIGLRDRVEVLGGRFDLVSPEGQGTTLVATVPVGVHLRQSNTGRRE
jgi:signal transduction histidine kinase